ncbi:sodium:solute symporter family protein [Spirochaeta africana]|uniref:Na+/proline symporter n=1 Tax=Spirochaeta africana (strain ATCC 700263 / DSM 8902 / Z-7692) TaxID=889378 RepID=H9UG01_SPIAZ|nr:sodium:solute symporter family protein [Spirochaeta africana]AFG36444.1 Na+/proline symporter [Spirochaeta africana DSM 8902]
MNQWLIWGAMAAWTLVTLLVAVRAGRDLRGGAAEFFIGGRRIKGFVSGMTYAATTYSAFMLVGLVGLTYSSGVGAYGFEMTYLLCTVLLLVVFGPRFFVVGRRFAHVTPPELLANRLQHNGVALTAAIISFVMLIPYSAVQMMGAGFLVEGLTGGDVPFMAGVLVMAVLAGVSALWAGMRSVAWTDALQAMTMLITSLTALLYIAFRYFGSPLEFARTIERSHAELLQLTWDPNLFIGLTLPWAFFALTNPQVSQRMYVPDSPRSLRRMIMYFSVFGGIYTVISILFGYQAAALLPGLENPDSAMPVLLSRIPAGIGLIMFLGIFAAATSTLGSLILTLSSLLSRDVVRIFKPDISDRRERTIGKLGMVILLLAGTGFAALRPGLITVLSSMSSGGLLVMAPTIVAVFFWKRVTAAGAMVSMIAAGLLTAGLYISGWYPWGIWPPVWGLGLSTLLLMIVSRFTSPPANAAEWLDHLRQDLQAAGFTRRKRS